MWQFCPKTGLPLQTQEPRLLFCLKEGLPLQTQEPRLQSAEDRSSTAKWVTKASVLLGMIGAAASRCFQTPNIFSIWADLKRSEKIPGAPSWRWGEWIWLTGPSGRHRNSPFELYISSFRVFDQIRDPEIPVTLRPNYESKNSSAKLGKNLRNTIFILTYCC